MKVKGLFIASLLFLLAGTEQSLRYLTTPQPPDMLWKYQCIDTMKTSRDDARKISKQKNVDSVIHSQVQEITSLGANCIAIDTPYDTEFFPYLLKWVTAARANHLHVWFRGSFSSWEGWFSYPQNTNYVTELKNTHDFILRNPQLFTDGDIFTALPEAENGGEFRPKSQDAISLYRQFLQMEVNSSTNAFLQLNKHVITNWNSISGGYAKEILNQQTIDHIGNTVTIDHYVSTPNQMSEYINYFHDTFNSTVVIGEFGAPIPEINGTMSDKQQADFVDSLLHELYENKSVVLGINYWTLTDGSTALYASTGAKPVTQVIKKYFKPGVMYGKILTAYGQPISHVFITLDNSTNSTETDVNGNFSLVAPQGVSTIRIGASSYVPVVKSITLGSNQKIKVNEVLKPSFPTLLENILYPMMSVISWGM